MFECVNTWFDLSPYRPIESRSEEPDEENIEICTKCLASVQCHHFCADLSLFARYLKRMAPMKQILETQLELQLAMNSVGYQKVPRAHMRPASLRKWRLASPVAWKMVLTTAELPRKNCTPLRKTCSMSTRASTQFLICAGPRAAIDFGGLPKWQFEQGKRRKNMIKHEVWGRPYFQTTSRFSPFVQ